jgi:hypothetical protein
MRGAVCGWRRQRLGDAERLEAIRARIRRSIGDPRPSMTEKQVDAHFKSLFAKTAANMQGDVDNRVKPILDAMVHCVYSYSDDEIIERVVVQKFEPGRIFAFQNPSAKLVSALQAQEPMIYIRITGDVHEELS